MTTTKKEKKSRKKTKQANGKKKKKKGKSGLSHFCSILLFPLYFIHSFLIHHTLREYTTT
jgi:hypothetical protein